MSTAPAPAAARTAARPCHLCGAADAALRHHINGYDIVRCRGCGLQYVAEDVTPAQLRAYYGEAYFTGGQPDGFQDYAAARETRQRHFRSLLPALRRHLRVARPRVLDVGSALGYFLHVAREAGWPARGVELSEYAAARARAEGFEVATGTVHDVDLPEGAFELVTLWDVIEHVPNPLAMLRRVHALLAEDGLLALSTGDVSGATARLYGRRWSLLAPPGHLFYFSRATLYRMLRLAGFEPLGCDSDGAFLVNQAEKPGSPSRFGRLIARLHRPRLVNAVLRRLKLGSVMTVYARRVVTR